MWNKILQTAFVWIVTALSTIGSLWLVGFLRFSFRRRTVRKQVIRSFSVMSDVLLAVIKNKYALRNLYFDNYFLGIYLGMCVSICLANKNRKEFDPIDDIFLVIYPKMTDLRIKEISEKLEALSFDTEILMGMKVGGFLSGGLRPIRTTEMQRLFLRDIMFKDNPMSEYFDQEDLKSRVQAFIH